MAKTPRPRKTATARRSTGRDAPPRAEARRVARRPARREAGERRRPRAPRLPSELMAATEAAQSRKALDVVVLDLGTTGAFTDYFLICTGSNPRQVQAIADAVQESLKQRGVRPAHVEGYERAEWILVDFFDFIVHVFSPAARQFYGLERLWGNAARVDLPEGDRPASSRPSAG